MIGRWAGLGGCRVPVVGLRARRLDRRQRQLALDLLINVPVAVVVLVLCRRCVPEIVRRAGRPSASIPAAEMLADALIRSGRLVGIT